MVFGVLCLVVLIMMLLMWFIEFMFSERCERCGGCIEYKSKDGFWLSYCTKCGRIRDE
jgi:hypothetical protein